MDYVLTFRILSYIGWPVVILYYSTTTSFFNYLFLACGLVMGILFGLFKLPTPVLLWLLCYALGYIYIAPIFRFNHNDMSVDVDTHTISFLWAVGYASFCWGMILRSFF